MSKWPWVSRELLEKTEKRLDAADAEKARLLDLLLAGVVPDWRREIAAVETAPATARTVDEGEDAEPQSAPMAYTTPFDEMKQRFALARKGGRIPAKYKARA